jgi:hypothetical protein
VKLRGEGKSHLEASFAARDLMDFSLSGAAPAVRLLTATVPFLNARLQGLYKLGRAGYADPRRVGAVLMTTALVGLALALAYKDDEDWKRRPDWDKENYFWFKIGDVAFRIPRPFEIGAFGSVVENAASVLWDDEMTGERFAERLLAIIGNQLAMNPIPQAFKPMLDVAANKNSFTGAPIESIGMERLLPQDRYTGRSTEFARAASRGLNAAAGVVGLQSLSPVQIDSLVAGYFAWVGTMTLAVADQLARPMLNRPARPSLPLRTMTGGIAENVSTDGSQSRYVIKTYSQARKLQEAYASWQNAGRLGDAGRKADILDRFGANLPTDARRSAAVQKKLSDLSRRRREVERGPGDGASKAREIFRINALMDQIAQEFLN